MDKKEFNRIATEIYGEDRTKWKFFCPWCKYEQSIFLIRQNINEHGYHTSQRYGKITKDNASELNPSVDQECLSPDCNFASYGLFHGNLEIEGSYYLELVGMNRIIKQEECDP